MTQLTCGTHTVFEWGRRHDDPAAGVVLAVRSKLFRDRNVSKIYTPPVEYQGRVGAVRFRRGDADFCVVVAYIPVEPHTQAQKQYNINIWQWIQHLLDQLPSRCLPVLLLDANGRVGAEPSPCVGEAEPQKQNYNGSLLHACLQHHHLFAVNTWYPCGPTYFGQFGNNSRIDYVCLPQSKQSSVQECTVLHSAGDRLQIISARGKRDHRPLLVRFRHCLSYEGSGFSVPWDRDKLVSGVLQGVDRDVFFVSCGTSVRRLVKVGPLAWRATGAHLESTQPNCVGRGRCLVQT